MKRSEMLQCVTVTGADDGVDPRALADLSAEFPFVEWGILFSPKREGSPRFPSRDWLNRLDALRAIRLVRLAAHLCGQAARDVFEGRSGWFYRWPEGFARIQLNGFSNYAAYQVTRSNICLAARAWRSTTFIMQSATVEMLADVERLTREAGRGHESLGPYTGNIVALFDASGGRGERATLWPGAPYGLTVGYAGGIGPDNVQVVLDELGGRELPFWIDMESRIRTDDRFDLKLVRSVLEQASEWLGGSL